MHRWTAILMSNRHQVKNGEPLVSDSEYSCGLAFGFGGMHSCSIGQVVVNIKLKRRMTKNSIHFHYVIHYVTQLIC